MPSWDIFEHQTQEYRDSVLPPERDGADRDRAGFHVRMGAIRRRDRPRDRHENIRSLGAAQGTADENSDSSPARVTANRKRTTGPRVNRCPVTSVSQMNRFCWRIAALFCSISNRRRTNDSTTRTTIAGTKATVRRDHPHLWSSASRCGARDRKERAAAATTSKESTVSDERPRDTGRQRRSLERTRIR